MSKEVKGVFVRLPLSEEVLATFNGKLRIEYDVKRDIAHLGGVEGGILAIGTPVTGGDLPTEVVRVREHRQDIHLPWVYVKAPPSDQDASEYELEVERLLTHEQAQAQIAALEAEVVRDSERLDWLLTHSHYGIPGFDPVVSGRTPEKRRADLIRAIDAAREAR